MHSIPQSEDIEWWSRFKKIQLSAAYKILYRFKDKSVETESVGGKKNIPCKKKKKIEQDGHTYTRQNTF